MWPIHFLWPNRKCLCLGHPLKISAAVLFWSGMLPYHGNSCPVTPPSKPPKTTSICVAPNYMAPAPTISISIYSTSVNGISSIVQVKQLAPSFRTDTPARKSMQLTPARRPPTTPPRTTKPRPPFAIHQHCQLFRKTTTQLSSSSVPASCSWPSSESAKSKFT